MGTTISPYLVLSPFPVRTTTSNPLFHRTHHFYTNPLSLSLPKPYLRGSTAVARFGFKPWLFPDPDSNAIAELLGRAESILYTLADAAVSSSDTVSTTSKQSNDWLSGITNYMETVLKVCLFFFFFSPRISDFIKRQRVFMSLFFFLGFEGWAIDFECSVLLWVRYNTTHCSRKSCYISFD